MTGEDTGATNPSGESRFAPGFAPECMACPIGLVFFAMRNTKPEVVEHLTKAAFEVFQAVKVLMDQYGERFERAQEIQRINID